ncbi:MAG: protein kinase [Anaerolineae bacterium]|nr:protein kinase [Anaerolineae bacterium]
MQDLSGRKLGQYELRERLGRGGMAEVYKSYQAGMDRFVAVKVMLGALNDDDSFVERFRREARAVGNLRHAHIVQAFDFGVEDGVYYLAMEYITGGNLKENIHKKGKLPVQDAVRVASQLADALGYAHDKGMVHRDMKPANVMFLDENLNHAILTDFGIARIMGEVGLTGTGMAVGTPDYMSPEAGRGETTDHRSDIYALGIILYEMLVGEVPYSADTPLAVIMKHINAPLPTRHDHDNAIPEVVETVILRCLAKNVNDRFQTAHEMKAALDKAMAQLDGSASTVAQPATSKPATAVSQSRNTVPTMIADVDAPTETMPVSKAIPLPAAIPPKKNNTALIGLGAIAVIAVIAIIAFFAINNDDGEGDSTPTSAPEVLVDVTEAATEESPTDEATIAATAIPTNEATIAATAVPTNEPTTIPEAQPTTGEPIPPPHPANLNLLAHESTLLDTIDELLLNGNPVRAQSNLDTTLSRDPENVVALFARSQLGSSTGNLEQARADAETVIELEPDRPLGYVTLSDTYVAEGANYQAGIDALETALSLVPDNPQVMWRRVRLELLESGDADSVQEFFDAAEESGASGWRFILFAGRYLHGQGLYGRALPYLETTVNEIPNRLYLEDDIEGRLQETLENLGMADGSEEIVEIPYDAEMPPNAENLMLTSGIAPIVDEIESLLVTDGQEAAIEAANVALADDPDNIEALFARALAYACCWDEENNARADANRIIELDPNNLLGYIAQGHAHLNYPDFDFEAAAVAIEQAHEFDPNDINALWRSVIFSEYDVQLERFDEAEEQGARGWQFITLAAGLLYENGEYNRAIPYLYIYSSEELSSEYDYWEARWRLMGALMQTDQAHAALDIANQYADDFDDAEAYINIAYVAYRAEEYEQARVWANTALALDGDAHAARYILALISWYGDEDVDAAIGQLNDLEEAEFFSFYLNFDFQHDINLDRARIFTDAGQVEEALEFYDAALEDWGYVAWLYEERADSHLELGNIEAARDDLETAREITDDDEYRRELLQRIIEMGPAPTSEPED